MKYDFLTIGGLTEDIVFLSEDGVLLKNNKDLLRQELLAFEYGAKIKIKEFGHYFGGGSSNVAVNLTKQGFKVSCLGRVGRDDRGQRIIINLKKNKVDCQNIEIDKKNNSGFSFILKDSKDRIIFTYRGSNDYFKISPQNIKNIKNSQWVYLTSLPDNYIDSLKKIFSNKNRIAWNPGLNQLSSGVSPIKSFLAKTEIFMVNKDEALELIKKTKSLSKFSNKFLNNCTNLIKILKSFGPKIVILTDGVRGAYFYDGNNFYHQKIVKEQKRVDSTGVGDAFNSTVVAFLEKTGGDFKKAMFLGVKNTASVVSRPGAQNGLLSFK